MVWITLLVKHEPFRFCLTVNKCYHCVIERTHDSVMVVVVGVGGVLDADGDGERAAGADPAAVGSAGRVEAPRDGADDEHEGAARADQGPRVGTLSFHLFYVFLRHLFNPLYVLLRHLFSPLNLRHLLNPLNVILRHLFNPIKARYLFNPFNVLLRHLLDLFCDICWIHDTVYVSTTKKLFLPPTNEVWGKVICLQVCVCPQRGCLVLGGVPGLGGAWWRPPRTATAADGTHPTGMHSCYGRLFILRREVVHDPLFVIFTSCLFYDMRLIRFTLFLRQANRQLQKDPTTEIQQLQEELIACKLREAEANLSMKELRQRVADLDKYWQVSTRLRAHSHVAIANAKFSSLRAAS